MRRVVAMLISKAKYRVKMVDTVRLGDALANGGLSVNAAESLFFMHLFEAVNDGSLRYQINCQQKRNSISFASFLILLNSVVIYR